MTQVRSSVRPRRVDGDDSTAERLLSTAERLFAERGPGSVSVRDITSAARANTAAIHYHFGSKEALIAAIVERRAAELGERRGRLLDEIEAARRPTLRDVVAAMVIPTAEMANDPESRYYVGFVASVLSHPETLVLFEGAFDRHTTRYLEALARVTPHLSPAVRAVRFTLAKEVVNRAFANKLVSPWISRYAGEVSEEQFIAMVIDFVTGAFRAPE